MSTDYKKLLLDRDQILQAVEDLGVTNIAYVAVPKGNGLHHLTGELNATSFLINVYLNKDGTVSLSKQTGKDDAIFEAVASQVVRKCSFAKTKAFSFSLQKGAADGCSLDVLGAFLEENDCQVEHKETKANPAGYDLVRWVSPYGDTVTIKQFTNKTVQFQGKNGLLASLIWDFVVVNSKDGIQEQLKAYEIAATPREIFDELAGRLDQSRVFLHDKVQKLLSSALSMVKVKVSLEDYGLVAFPAIRALEGYLIQTLVDTEFTPVQASSFGDYFVKNAAKNAYVMRDEYADFAKAKKGNKRVLGLSQIYTYWHDNRHRGFHMDATIETSKMTPTLSEAAQVVDEVLHLIEHSYTEMRT